jgi:hypothetical protein
MKAFHVKATVACITQKHTTLPVSAVANFTWMIIFRDSECRVDGRVDGGQVTWCNVTDVHWHESTTVPLNDNSTCISNFVHPEHTF